MFTSKRKLITIEDKPISDPERIKDIILLQANRWLAIHYPDHKTALLNVEIYSDETSLGLITVCTLLSKSLYYYNSY